MNTENVICSVTGIEITREMVIGCISDTYKSVNGIRPRWMDFSDMTMVELGDLLTDLQEVEESAYLDEMKWEQEQQIRDKKEKDAKILELIAMGAGNKETAEKWLLDDYYKVTWEAESHLENERENYPEEAEIY